MRVGFFIALYHCVMYNLSNSAPEESMEETIFVNKKEYLIKKLLGHGKGGYSYLVKQNEDFFVLKQIHHEPCDYYTFGNKIEAEQNDYYRLADAGINIPRMLDIDIPNERIVKEYIEGPSVFELIKDDVFDEKYLEQVRKMAAKATTAKINIDYFPTNFIVRNEILYYVDYECNDYMEKWDFEHWGIKYWSKTPEFIEYMNSQK